MTATAVVLTRGRRAVEVVLIFCVFFLYGASPPPGVNEPHYLGKAKHYWNPAWCAGDQFLESADAHQLFYWSFGWLTLWLTLPAVAWVGRLLTWALLAWAWQRLSYAVVPRPLASVLSAALFISALGEFNFAGEWVIGGVEAKGFAYVLVLLGIESLVRGQWNRVWMLLGGATAFHVLVGGWSLLAIGVAWLLEGRERPSIRAMLPGLAVGFGLSLVGLIPALLLSHGVDPEIAAEANRIQVFERLRHHLALHKLELVELLPRLRQTGLLLLVFAALAWLTKFDLPAKRVRNFVLATVLFALAGLAICYGTASNDRLATSILRFYWFRLYDVALPLGFGLLAVLTLCCLLETKGSRALTVLALLLVLAFPSWYLAGIVRGRHRNPRSPADTKMGSINDWIAACHWARDNTPDDASFIVPRKTQTFEWHAGRSDAANWKDMPQDPASVVAWYQRIDDLYPMEMIAGEEQRSGIWRFGEEAVLREAKKAGAGWLIVQRRSPDDPSDWVNQERVLNFPRRYQNESFVIYELETPKP